MNLLMQVISGLIGGIGGIWLHRRVIRPTLRRLDDKIAQLLGVDNRGGRGGATP